MEDKSDLELFGEILGLVKEWLDALEQEGAEGPFLASPPDSYVAFSGALHQGFGQPVSPSAVLESGTECPLEENLGCAGLPGWKEPEWPLRFVLGLTTELLLLSLETLDLGLIEVAARALVAEAQSWIAKGATLGCAEVDAPVYRIASTHDRLKSFSDRADLPMRFTGAVKAVLVELPEKPLGADHCFKTKLGTVDASDHVAFSREEIFEGYAATFTQHDKELTKPPYTASQIDRVELITGARAGAHRFCPVSVYIAYGKVPAGTEERPLFWAIQSSDFTGLEARLYFSRCMDSPPIIARSGFQPTPFSRPFHTYRFWMDRGEEGFDPSNFTLKAQLYFGGSRSEPSHGDLVKYMEMTMAYVREERGAATPLRAQAVAYARVCHLETKQKMCHWSATAPQRLLHELATRTGAKLPWDNG